MSDLDTRKRHKGPNSFDTLLSVRREIRERGFRCDADGSTKMVTKKYERFRPLYRHFAREYEWADFSDEAFEELFLYESKGEGGPAKDNGYAIGKRAIDITVAMWLEDLPGPLITKAELYEDPNLPDWWLEKVIGRID